MGFPSTAGRARREPPPKTASDSVNQPLWVPLQLKLLFKPSPLPPPGEEVITASGFPWYPSHTSLDLLFI